MVDDRRSVDHVVVNVVVENHDMILIVSCDESFDDASLSYCLLLFALTIISHYLAIMVKKFAGLCDTFILLSTPP